MRYVFLVGSMTLVVLSACSQAAATPAPASQPLLDDMVMLRMALHFGWSPRPYIEMTGAPTEVRASRVITYEEAVKFRGGQLYPDTGDYQRKDELVRLYVFRGDITGLHYEIPEGGGPQTWVSTKIAQLMEIVNASTGQGMGSSGRHFGAELDVSMLELIEIPDDIYSIVPVTIAAQPPVTEAPPATPAPKAPHETPTPAPTQTPSLRTTPTGCSEREEEPPCGPGVEIGKSYSYTLYTHCGVRSAFIDGRRWIADPIPRAGVGGINPPPGWGDPFQGGAVELVTDALARFTSGEGLTAEFRPLLPEGSEYPWRPCL